MIERYGRTERVRFTGEEYQLAKLGVQVMDELARVVDLPTAVEAANWSEDRVNRISTDCAHVRLAAAVATGEAA